MYLGRVEFNLLKKFQEYCRMFNKEERESAYTYTYSIMY